MRGFIFALLGFSALVGLALCSAQEPPAAGPTCLERAQRADRLDEEGWRRLEEDCRPDREYGR